MRRTMFGDPPPVRVRSMSTVLAVDPMEGFLGDKAPQNLPPTASPSCVNFIAREGALEPRAMLVSRNTQATTLGVPILGGLEASDINGNTYPFASGTTRPTWYSVGSWSYASYVSAGGVNAPPSNSSGTYFDMTQIYYDRRDQNMVVFASQSYQTLFCWQSNTTVFSTLTGAPMAKSVAAYDNYLLAFNVQDPSGTGTFVQRVQWSDRGSASSWTGGLAGYTDLIDMRGPGTKLLAENGRLLAFSEFEVWAGRNVGDPFGFDFQPFDRSIGCPHPWTIQTTRKGTIFLGADYQIYLLPAGGGTAQPIGQPVHKLIRDNIDQAARSWAVVDPNTEQYQLFYPVRGGNGRPQKAVYLDLESGAWMPQEFDTTLGLSFGFAGHLGTGSAATTWASAGAAGLTWAGVVGTWAQQEGTANAGALTVYAGLSNGSMGYFSSNATGDYALTVPCKWQSAAIGGDLPERRKILTEVRVDYVAESASSLTIRTTPNQGQQFQDDQRVVLTQQGRQAIGYTYCHSRYPRIEVQLGEGTRARLYRFWAKLALAGRST